MTIDSELLDPRFHATCPAWRCHGAVTIPVDDDMADSLLGAGVTLAMR